MQPMALANGLGLGHVPTSAVSGGEGLAALWSADFVNGAYLVDGETAAVGDMFVEDQDDWGAPYDAADIVGGVGYRPDSAGQQGPVLTGAARTAILGGFTLVGEVNLPNLTNFFCDFHERLTFATEYETRLQAGGNSTIQDFIETPVTLDALSAGAHKFALIYADGEIHISLNGGAVSSLSPAATWDPAPDALGLAVTGSGGAGHSSIQRLTAYAPVDASELPTLSTP